MFLLKTLRLDSLSPVTNIYLKLDIGLNSSPLLGEESKILCDYTVISKQAFSRKPCGESLCIVIREDREIASVISIFTRLLAYSPGD